MDFDRVMMLREAAVGLDDLAEVMPQGPPAPAASERDRFWSWVEDPAAPTMTPVTLAATLHHLSTFFAVRDEPNVVLLHYGDLKAVTFSIGASPVILKKVAIRWFVMQLTGRLSLRSRRAIRDISQKPWLSIKRMPRRSSRTGPGPRSNA